MTNQNKVLIVIGLIIAVFIGYAMTQGESNEAVTGTQSGDTMNESETMMNDEMDDTEMMDDDRESMEAEDTVMDGDESMMDDDMEASTEVEASASTPGEYLAYSPEAVANSDADSIVLSFSATWCPSCRTLDNNINENLSSIPSGVEIYKVDYDTNVALRQQYGVTTQHTMVQVDSNGNQIQKWSGGNTLVSLIAKI